MDEDARCRPGLSCTPDPAKLTLTGIDLGLVLGLLYIFPIVATVVSDPHWARHLQQIGPMNAGLAIQTTVNVRGLPIGPWAGLAVLAIWAAGALLTGALVLCYRDG